MKKQIALAMLAVALTGCGANDSSALLIAVEQGIDASDIEDKTAEYCGEPVELEEVSSDRLGERGYYVSVGYIRQDDAVDYGLIKTKPYKSINLCAVACGEYRHSSELSGCRVGIYGDVDYTKFIALPTDCTANAYKDMGAAVSDLSGGAVDCIVCLPDDADKIVSKGDSLRACDIEDSEIYELVAISGDSGLIEYLER